MAIQYVCSFESPKPEEFGTIKPQKSYFSCPTDSAALKNCRYWRALSLYFNSGLITNVKDDSNRVQQMLAPHIGGNT